LQLACIYKTLMTDFDFKLVIRLELCNMLHLSKRFILSSQNRTYSLMFGGVKSQIINTLHPTKNQETITTTNHKATSLRTFSSDLEIIIEVLVLQSCFES